jgi:hypothetical protein
MISKNLFIYKTLKNILQKAYLFIKKDRLLWFIKMIL